MATSSLFSNLVAQLTPTYEEDIEAGSIGSCKQHHSIWTKKIIAVSCVFALLVDPLFFYIPVVKEDTMCLGLDINLKKVVLVLRTITDVFYLLDIRLHVGKLKHIYKYALTEPNILSESEKLTKHHSWLRIQTDIFALLPLPQVIILIFFSKMWGSTSYMRVILYSVVLIQYVPRVFRMYLSRCSTSSVQTRTGIWIKGVSNFFPFILAGHVTGAIWYSLAIQRETACWDHFCGIENGCEATSFSCGHNGLRNTKLLQDSCPLVSSASTNYDFGIFLGALQYGTLGSTDFLKKLLQCFWWGLRNLSSLGSNLQTSSNQWENVFAIFIFFSGMILFLVYLSSTFQTLNVKLEAMKADKLRVKRQMQLITPEVDMWLDKNGLPRDLRTVIIRNVQIRVQANEHVDVENFLSILPREKKKDITTRLRFAALRKVPLLETMRDKVLERISVRLKLIIYEEDNYVIREGEPVDKMIFITQGTAWSYTTSPGGGHDSNTKCLGKGDFYGDELLNWAFDSRPFLELPVSTRIVKSQSKLEAFVIRANDLKTVLGENFAASIIQQRWHNQRTRNGSARRDV